MGILKKQQEVVLLGVLIKEISYYKNDKLIIVKEGTHIKIDLDKQIALVFEDHVDIHQDEYTLII